MPLNRRQFFRSFWSPQKTLAQRQEQYRIMKSYVGAILIPFDFSLTPEQTSEVFDIADSALQACHPTKISSPTPFAFGWTSLSNLVSRLGIWNCLIMWSKFGKLRRTTSQHSSARHQPRKFEQLMKRFGITDWDALDTELRKQIQSWINGFDNENVRKYDTSSVKDLVFTELRSWC